MKYITSKEAIQIPKTYHCVSYVWNQQTSRETLLNLVKDYGEYLAGIGDEYPIWLDIISNRDELGNNSIEGIQVMNRIHAGARSTIAIIAEIRRCILLDDESVHQLQRQDGAHYENMKLLLDTSKDVSELLDHNLEVILAMSKWFTRAWTLQEQILSNKIMCKIRDHYIDITNIVHDIVTLEYLGTNIRNIKYIVEQHLLPPHKVIDNITHEYRRFFIGDGCIYSKLKDMQHDKALNELKYKSATSSLTLVEALALVSCRVMGPENKKYEPIQSLVGDMSTIAEGHYPIRAFVSNELRSNRNNMCWLPTRLNTDNTYNVRSLNFKLNSDGSITLLSHTLNMHRGFMYHYTGDINEKKRKYIQYKVRSVNYLTRHIKLHYIGLIDGEPKRGKTFTSRNYKIDVGYSDERDNLAVKTRIVDYSKLLKWIDSKKSVLRDMIGALLKSKKSFVSEFVLLAPTYYAW